MRKFYLAGMVPATFATGTEENVVWSPVYNFTRSAFTTQPKDADGNASWLVQYATDASLLNRNVSTGEWEYAGGYVSSLPSTSFQKEYLSIYNSFGSQNYAAIVFEITVDESGYYKPTFTYKKYNRANVLNMWIASKEEFDNTQTKYDLMVKDDINNLIYWWGDKGTAPAGGLMGTKIGSVDAYDVSESLLNGEYTNETPVYIAAGKYYLFIQPTKGTAWEKYSNGEQTASAVYLTPTSLTLTRQPTMETTASKTTLAVGDSATLTSEVTSGENQDITATSEVTYTTVDTEIISIDGDMVTALAEGTATITATAANGATDTVEIKVEAKKISLAYTTSVDESGDIEVDAYEAGSVTVNAPEKTGYTFSHWVRGTAASGVWVSADASYTFDLVSPTYLTAIYVEENAKIVEFFNGNSELLAQETVKEDGTVEKPADPSMVGFRFLRWITAKDVEFVNADIIAPLTRVVAEFEDDTATYNVAGQTDVKYDTAITKTSNSEVAWKRGNVVVGYGTSYTYNVWADVESITSEAISEKKPLVYIDPTVKDVGAEKACMIEFDGAGMEIVEVGILFSAAGTTPEVGSCMYKATSKTNGGDDGHGQLTAKPANNTQTVARGYIIYIDNGEYKTEYSEVLGLND